MQANMSHRELTAHAQASIVPVDRWANRDTPAAQRQVGELLGRLLAGCAFEAWYDEDTLQVLVWCPDYEHPANTIDHEMEHPSGSTKYYLPTPKRLKDAGGRDWY